MYTRVYVFGIFFSPIRVLKYLEEQNSLLETPVCYYLISENTIFLKVLSRGV